MGNRSIRTELLALLLIIAIPGIGLQAYWALAQYRGTVARAEEDVLRAAEAVAGSTGQLLQLGHGVLAKLAASLAAQPTLDSGCTRRLEGLPDVLFFSNVAVWDSTGRLVCSSSPTRASPRATVEDRTWFQKAMAHGAPVLSEPMVGRITGRWVVNLAHPVREVDGRILGVVAGGLDLVELGTSLASSETAAHALVTIATGANAVVYRSEGADQWVGRVLDGPEVSERSHGDRGVMTHAVDMSGVARTFAKVAIAGTSWHVFVGMPDAVILPPARQRATVDAAAVVALLVLAGAGALWYYRRIARALLDLQAGITSSAVGHPMAVRRESPAEVHAVGARINAAIRARQEAEQAEREAKERLRSIVDNAFFGIYLSTPDGRFLEVNNAMVAIAGYASREALLGVHAGGLFADRARHDALLAQALRDGSTVHEEVEWLQMNGRPIIVRLNGRVGEDARAGTTLQFVVEDVTEQRALEHQYRQAQQLELVGQMAGGIAHDFNNLLAVIIGKVELTRQHVVPTDPLAEDLDQVLAAGQRAAALTRQLLNLSSRRAGNPEILDLGVVVQELQQMLVSVLRADIQLNVEVEAPAGRVRMVRGMLDRLLMNLVLNARDALPRGGAIRVSVATGSLPAGVRPVPTAAALEGEWVSLTVADDGVGMTPAVQERIFEPFFTTKAPGAGTGLGLATALEFVSTSGGYIHCESSPGQGTTFRVYLPIAQPENTVTPARVTRQTRSSAMILLVEDVAEVRQVIERGLTASGHHVRSVEGAEQAHQLLEREGLTPDLLITDVMMPGLSGPEFATQARAIIPGLPVLFISGFADDDAGLLLADHVDRTGFLGKPFTIAELLTEVDRLLNVTA